MWHDRAVFHFQVSKNKRQAYINALKKSLVPGGKVIIATFGPQGPEVCSGLRVRRYSDQTLSKEFGSQFKLLDSRIDFHSTPFGTTQQFLYCCFEYF